MLVGQVFSPLDEVSNEALSFCLFTGQHSTIGFDIELGNFCDPHKKHRIQIYLCWKSENGERHVGEQIKKPIDFV